mmetsp:Transcript_15736/g.2608  ORF Transcript_15736/g.2608 Transcript_15736/m.2608 type:complete len:107 (+) Transcript_15736:124-444(+)
MTFRALEGITGFIGIGFCCFSLNYFIDSFKLMIYTQTAAIMYIIKERDKLATKIHPKVSFVSSAISESLKAKMKQWEVRNRNSPRMFTRFPVYLFWYGCISIRVAK